MRIQAKIRKINFPHKSTEKPKTPQTAIAEPFLLKSLVNKSTKSSTEQCGETTQAHALLGGPSGNSLTANWKVA